MTLPSALALARSISAGLDGPPDWPRARCGMRDVGAVAARPPSTLRRDNLGIVLSHGSTALCGPDRCISLRGLTSASSARDAGEVPRSLQRFPCQYRKT